MAESINQEIYIENNKSNSSRYRPEIDGLRAFAVVAVIINHCNKDILPGGYLGVDIFFVISGYVITSSLFGRPSIDFKDFISGFYERRIKRLIPVLVIFTLITSVLIAFFDPNPQIALRTGSASLFGLSNIYLFQTSTDYFAQSTELNPFVHTWSLGVEEQFYLLFPFLVWFSGFGKQTPRGERNLFLLVGTLTVVSITSFIYLQQVNQPAAYFLMPSRFWEMSAGCLLFISLQKNLTIARAFQSVPPLVTIATIVAVMLLPVSEAIPATIAVVFLSVILISCLRRGTFSFNLFTHKSVVYIGLISYSLYLWHWSILAISRWTIGIHWWSVPLQLMIILCAAMLSNNLIEKTFRHRKWSRSAVQTIIYGVGVASISAALIYESRKYSEFFFLGKVDTTWRGISSTRCFSGKKFPEQVLVLNCTLPAKSSDTPSLISIGDSQTGHLRPILNRLHVEHGSGIMYYTHAGLMFPSIREIGSVQFDTLKKFDDAYTKHLNAYKVFSESARAGDILVISSKFISRWGLSQMLTANDKRRIYFDKNNVEYAPKDAFKAWKESILDITEQASKKGLRVVLFTSFPTISGKIPKCLSDPQWFNNFDWCNATDFDSRDEIYMNSAPVNDFLIELAHNNYSVYLFDQFDSLCPSSDNECNPYYTHDGIHLSRVGRNKLYHKLIDFLFANKLLER